MDKEEILKKSREENKGIDGEYEKSVFAQGVKRSFYIGWVVCLTLVLVSRYIFASPEAAFAAFIMFFSMQAGLHLTMFAHLKEKNDLILGIIDIVATVGFVIALVYLWMTSSH